MTDEERAYNYASKQKASKFQIGEIAKFYNDGYQQAEKDLELTWKDVRDILNLYEDVIEMDFCEDIYGEVLKRFKDLKK